MGTGPYREITFNRMLDHGLLPKGEERSLLEKAVAGDTSAQQRLVEHNVRFAFSLAKEETIKMYGRFIWDVIERATDAGILGLYEAIEKYSLKKSRKAKKGGYMRFQTYAGYMVKKNIREEIDKLIDEHNHGFANTRDCNYRAFRRVVGLLEAELRHFPSFEEFHDAVNRREDMPVTPLVRQLFRGYGTLRYKRLTDRCKRRVLSLDRPAGKYEDTLAEVVSQDNRNLQPDDNNQMRLLEELRGHIALLTPRQRQIIEERHLSGNANKWSEIAERLGITVGTIKQHYKRGIRKLREFVDEGLQRTG